MLLEDISTRNVYSRNGKWEEEMNSGNARMLVVDDEHDLCMVYQIVYKMLVMNACHIQIQLNFYKNPDLPIVV
jgi:hypothetical protein